MNFFKKMSGITVSPPRVHVADMMWSWIGAFVGIAAIGLLNYRVLGQTDSVLMIGSFGASSVLVYGAIRSPLSQPRNLLGGHVLSALIGVACYRAFSDHAWLAASLAVSWSIVAMHATKTLHPPAGATALIAVVGSPKIHDLGLVYAFSPIGAGVMVLLVIALIVNNVPPSRRYPSSGSRQPETTERSIGKAKRILHLRHESRNERSRAMASGHNTLHRTSEHKAGLATADLCHEHEA